MTGVLEPRRSPTRTVPIGRDHVPSMLVVDEAEELGGAQLALLESLRSLAGEWRLQAFSGPGALADRLGELGVAVHSPGALATTGGPRRSAGLARQLASLGTYVRRILSVRSCIRQGAFDLVYINTLRALPYGVIAGRLSGATVVVHVRDILDGRTLPQPVVRQVVRALLRTSHVVLANSRTTARSVPAGAAVVYSPVSPAYFAPPVPAGETRRIGIVGRLDPWKGQDLFLRAFAQAGLAATHQAVIIGGPLFGRADYQEELRRLATSLGLGDRVEFTGQVDDVIGALDGLDVLVCATRDEEPFGQVVLQGLARGKCVIAPAAGGPAEQIEDGVSGLLFRPGNVDHLASALRRVVDDPGLRTRLGRSARTRAEWFAPERQLGRWRSILCAAAAGQPIPEEGDQ
ncbi:MAG: glycosyltransferase [Frankiales bacterium]|nr:glycosyltransferase [Frankiales bacterium]